MLLYTNHKSNRLSYVAKHLTSNFLSEELIVTDNKTLFENEKGFKINYSGESLESSLQVIPEGLLFEESIRTFVQEPFVLGLDEKASLDVFSLIFYHISRYEEYQIKERDEHNRFDFNSLSSFQQERIKRPFLDIIIIDWLNLHEERLGIKLMKERTFSFHCTFDIDVAYAYKGRGPLRSMGSSIKNRMKGKPELNKERKAVLKGEIKDPFDTYDFQKAIIKKYGLNAYYFFLLSTKGKYDHGLHPESLELQELINFTSDFANVGIHPSYRSHTSFEELENERNRLENITGSICKISRQHFLKFNLPETFRNLIKLGIEVDFSLGYSRAPLFRAGTCFPFYWFDLEKNASTKLKLMPLSWMESTFVYNEDLSLKNARDSLLFVIEEIKKVGGHFVSLWHNNHLCDNEEFSPWRELFQNMVDRCTNS